MSNFAKQVAIHVTDLAEIIIPAMLRHQEPQITKAYEGKNIQISFSFAANQTITFDLCEIEGNMILEQLSVDFRLGYQPTRVVEQILRDRKPRLAHDLFDHLQVDQRVRATMIAQDVPVSSLVRKNELFAQIPSTSLLGAIMLMLLREQNISRLYPEMRQILRMHRDEKVVVAA